MGLPRCRRVLSRRDFDRAMRHGRRVGSRNFVLYAAANDKGVSRLGLAIGRKTDGRAVGRNRWKRLLREVFRTVAGPMLPAVDLVVVVRPAEAARGSDPGKRTFRPAPDRAALVRELLDALRRFHGLVQENGSGASAGPGGVDRSV